MTNTPASLRLRIAALVALAALTACSGTVVGGEGTGGGDTQDPHCNCGPVEPEPAPAPAPAVNAIAIRGEELASDLGYGGGPDYGLDGQVFLEIGNPAPTCAVPEPSFMCATQFSVSIGIPTALLQPGVFDLSDPQLASTYTESGASTPPDDACPGGGGSFVSGTLTIQSVDAASIAFTLAGTSAFELGSASADGAYVATLCP